MKIVPLNKKKVEMKESIKETAMNKIASLEGRLAGLLKPITPRREFVNKLGSRIHVGTRAVFVDRVANIHLLAVIAAGFLSLLIFLAVVLRALFSLPPKKKPEKA
jgi:hypothetical protein